MGRTIFFICAALPLIFVFLHSCHGQFNPYQPAPAPPQARNSIPDMITGCYSNFSAYNRFSRKPMHIDNLISIIRKIEDKTDQQWDVRRIARVLVHRFMYDGMKYDGAAKQELRYGQEPNERAKSMIVKDLIQIPVEEFLPDGILDNDEKCSLHWMLSHSLNSSMREEELFPGYNPGSNPYNPNQNNNNNNGNGNGYGYNNNNNNNNNNNGFNNNNPNNPYNPMNPSPGNNGNVPNMGGNNYYRGRRDTSGNLSGNQTFDFSKATNDSLENDSVSYEQDDYDVADNNKTVGSGPLPKSSEGKKDKDDDDVVDVDVLLSDASTTGTGSKSARQVAQQDYKQRSKRPVETGVIYTKWGGVAAGRLLSGIAAGLQLTQMSVYSGVVSQSQGNVGGPNPWSSGSGIGQPGNNNNNNNNNNNPNNGFGSGAGSGSGSWSGNGGYPSKSVVNSNNNGYPPYQAQPQPQQPPAGQRWSGRKKRQIQNLEPLDSIYAATLAGDAGQSAVLNAKYDIRNNGLPTGEFNDTICPREFLLMEQYGGDFYKPSTTWTYLTEAEVRGGLDGFILGANIRRWDPSYTLRLSDILQQYYSDQGIAAETNFRACERSSLMNQYVDRSKLKEQTKSFAYLYNNRTNMISDQKFVMNPSIFDRLVDEAYDRMSSAAASFSGIGPCQPNGVGGDYNDDQKLIIPKLTVYGVLDHTATTWEIQEQTKFLGQLAYELNVSPTGSRVGIVDGNSGNMIISPNWTDSSSSLACRAMDIIPQTRPQDYVRVLTSLKTELERVRSEELRNNYTTPNGVVILLIVQGRKLEEQQIDDIIRLTREINEEAYDVTVVTTSSKFSEADFGFDEDDEQIRHVKLEQRQGNMSDLAADFVKSLIKNTHSALRYIQCDPELYDQADEHVIPSHLFLNPNSIEYYRVSPDYFYRSRALVLRFSSLNGKVRICLSRKERYPNANNNQDNSKVECKETTGNYVAVGRSETDVEFKGGDLNKPCGKNGKRPGCDPIYISITPIEYRGPGQVGMDCSLEGCQSSNQIKVTFTHWGMRCDGVRSVLSSTVAFITLSLALLNWLKST